MKTQTTMTTTKMKRIRLRMMMKKSRKRTTKRDTVYDEIELNHQDMEHLPNNQESL